MHCYKVLQSSVFSRPQFVRGIGCDECWVGLGLEQVNSRDDRNPPRPPPTPCPARWVLNRRPFACKAEPLTWPLMCSIEFGQCCHQCAFQSRNDFDFFCISIAPRKAASRARDERKPDLRTFLRKDIESISFPPQTMNYSSRRKE